MPENGESGGTVLHYAEAFWMVVKGRKGRHLFLTLFLATMGLALFWSYSIDNFSPTTIPRPAEGVSQAPPSTDNDDAAPGTPKLAPLPFPAKNGPTFRLLMPAAESDVNFCRSVLSTMLLDYPPATILGYYSQEQTVTIGGAVYAHLKDPHIRDDDLILVADGYRSWFQLPSSVLIEQYQRVTADANKRLNKTYGVLQGGGGAESQQRFRQTVLFAADTHCMHSTDNDVACDAVPDAPGVWERTHAANHTSATVYNPKFLSSGIVMGPARDLRAVFAAAVKKSTGAGDAGGAHDLQRALQTIYSEQEQAREAVRRSNLGAADRVRQWLYSTVGQSQFLRGRRNSSAGRAVPGSGGMSGRKLSIKAGHDYEFGIGLDYDSALFQSMSAPHVSNGDVEFLAAAAGDDTPAFAHPSMRALPPALAALPSPFHMPAPDKASEDLPENATTPLTLTPGLDDLPHDMPWSGLPLARNLLTGAAPASLHFPPRRSAGGGGGGGGSSNRIAARSLPLHTLLSPRSPQRGPPRSPPKPQATPGAVPRRPPPSHYRRPPPPAPTKQPPPPSPPDDADAAVPVDPDTIYRRLWFVPYARALLRRHMRRTTLDSLLDTETAAVAEEEEGEPNSSAKDSAHGSAWRSQRDRELQFDGRGGRGGVWTQQGQWLAWEDICRGREHDVFDAADDWGEWGLERKNKGLDDEEKKEEEKEEEKEEGEKQKEEEKKPETEISDETKDAAVAEKEHADPPPPPPP